MNDLMGFADVARELQTTPYRVKALLEGVEPAVTAQNGRLQLFTRTDVRKAVRTAHSATLTFLGILSEEESYDSVVSSN